MRLYKSFFFKIYIIILLSCTSLKVESSIKKFMSFAMKDKVDLVTLWKVHTGNHISNINSHLNLVCAGNIVYIADRQGTVRAINIYNGKEKWVTNLAKKKYSYTSIPLLGGVNVYGEYIYIGTENAEVYSLSTKDGSKIWNTKVAGEVLSVPVPTKNGLILIHTSNDQLQALNEIDGQIKWTTDLNSSLILFSLRGESSPAIKSNIAVVGSNNGLVSAIRIQDGEVIWQQNIFQISSDSRIDDFLDIDISPIIIKDKVYILSYNGILTSFNLNNGQIIWKIKIDHAINFVIDNNSIYILCQNDKILAVNSENGSIFWKQNSLLHRTLTAPLFYNNLLIVGDKRGYLYYIDARSGRLVFHKKINKSGFFSAPVIVDHKLLIQTKNGVLCALVI